MRGMMEEFRRALVACEKKGKTAQTRLYRRYYAQMARELLLFQASDWAFMIHNKSAADYARFRENTHYRNVCALYAAAMTGLAMGRKKPDTSLLNKLENQDNIFPWIGELL